MNTLNQIPTNETIASTIDTRLTQSIETISAKVKESVLNALKANSCEENVEFINENAFYEPMEETPRPRNPVVAAPSHHIPNEVIQLENMDAENKKKYRSRESERIEKYHKARQQFGINLTKEMVRSAFAEDIMNWPDSKVFIEPVYRKNILNALKNVLHIGTGVRVEYISIKAFHCTLDKDGAIAWVTMSEKINSMMYAGAAEQRISGFKMFASIPAGAIPRRRELVKILKDINNNNKCIKYQIRAGYQDIKLMLKYQEDNEYARWREVPLSTIDQCDSLPDFVHDTPDPSDEPEIASSEEMSNYSNEELWIEVGRSKKKNSVTKMENKRRFHREYPVGRMTEIVLQSIGRRQPNQ